MLLDSKVAATLTSFSNFFFFGNNFISDISILAEFRCSVAAVSLKMTTNSVGQGKWEDAFRTTIRSWVENKTIDLWSGKGRLLFIESLCSLGIAIHSNNAIEINLKKLERCEIPQHMSNRFSDEDLVDAPLLHFGAGTDLKLVKFVVERREVSRERVLLDYSLRNADGRNALHIALDKDQKEIVDYLLEEWIARPVSILFNGSFWPKTDKMNTS
jgi:hypothetical protein